MNPGCFAQKIRSPRFAAIAAAITASTLACMAAILLAPANVTIAANVAAKPKQTASESPVKFDDLLWFVDRAKAAYDTPAEIRERFPNTTRVAQPDGTEVQYFLECDELKRRHVVAVRGTANLTNVFEDLEYLRVDDERLGIAVHRGFHDDALAIYTDLKPHLRKDYEIVLTGHSLGAAVSTLLMLYLDQDGFSVARSVNFGQPKLTNSDGAKRFSRMPLLRVVDHQDVVPTLPTATLLDSIGGLYAHFGDQITLLDGPRYAFIESEQAWSASKLSFWKELGDESLSDHAVSRYEERIRAKRSGSERVPFKLRVE
ncbi:MAG: lipase family protein [Pseudomonadota bacterium]